MSVRCTQCGRFCPANYLALNRWGDYGGGPLEDDTLCDACDGPASGSDAYYAKQAELLGLDEEGLTAAQRAEIAQWEAEDAAAAAVTLSPQGDT